MINSASHQLTNAPALVATGVLICLLVVDLRSDVRRIVSARNMVLLGVFLWFLLEAIQLPEALNQYSQAQYNFGIVCVLLAMASFLLAYRTSDGGAFDDFSRRLRCLDDHDLQWRLTLLGIGIGMAPLLVLSNFDLTALTDGIFGLKARWTGPFSRGRYGGVRDALLELQMFLKAALPLALVILFNHRQPTVRRVVCGVFAVWMVLRAFAGGTRSELLLVALPVIAAVYWKLSPRLQQRAVLVGLPVLALIGYVWAAAVVNTRNQGDFEWSAAGTAEYVGHEMFRELLFITSRIPDDLPLQYGSTYYVQLVNPIPRFLWSGKPTGDAGILMAQAAGEVDPTTGETYLTHSPGLIGEMYMNFALLGVILLSAFGGWLARSWDNLRRRSSQSFATFLVFSAGLAILLAFGRSFNMHPMYGLLALYALLLAFGPSVPAVRRRPSVGRKPRPRVYPAPINAEGDL